MHALTELIKSDMKPALGVTEPGAIAFAVSTAKAHIKGTVKRVGLRLNSGMYKNAFTCGIPGTSEVGNYFNFDTSSNKELVVKVALSAVSTEGALKNLLAEAGSMKTVFPVADSS